MNILPFLCYIFMLYICFGQVFDTLRILFTQEIQIKLLFTGGIEII